MRKSILTLATVCLLTASCSKKDQSSINTTVAPMPDTSISSSFSVSTPSIPAGTFTITSYGASTSSSDNTAAVVSAINAAFSAGGGTVVVPSGTFLCGPIALKNNVGLQLSSGAVLKALAYGTYPGSGATSGIADFIKLDGLTNVKVSGSGTLEGQGSAWWSAYLTSKAAGAAIDRPCMINFASANTVEISGIKIQNAPNVHITVGKNSNSSTISGVTISSPSTAPNTDGIDTWSPNVNITNCNISCGDDNIAMNNESKYVTISGCTFGTGHGCSIGSYTANIDHIIVDNCTFNGTDNGAHLKSNRTRSGTVQYLTFSNLTMTNVSTPITFIEYYPDNTIPSTPGSDPAQAVTTTTPVWKHITLKNITATGASKAGNLIAVPEKPMTDIVFDNVKITASTGFRADYATAVSFINGSKITVSSGNAFTSTYASTITGINLTTGAPL
ncbi:MAG: glycosyl hydrolase family 28 protein [Mucilaginibacter sp.]|uniref:glycoside hydrolase family 28 protein n=1 Tax=Mucilaginibacter sp. TaxID=1882438 RepID=UPI003266CD14